VSEKHSCKVGRALDERGIAYMVIGGQVVLLYGEPRLTEDCKSIVRKAKIEFGAYL